MQKMHSKRPKFSTFFGGAYPWTPTGGPPPVPKILPPIQIPIENPAEHLWAPSNSQTGRHLEM